VDGVRFVAPDGREYRRPVFRHQPTALTYNDLPLRLDITEAHPYKH